MRNDTISFDEIELTWREKKLLSSLSDADLVIMGQISPRIDRLIRLGFADTDFLFQDTSLPVSQKNTISITNLGHDYLAYLRRKAKDRRRDTRRYWITTAIALVALFFSIIAIAAELHWLELPQALFRW